jgi:hypothetical protein
MNICTFIVVTITIKGYPWFFDFQVDPAMLAHIPPCVKGVRLSG